MKRYILQLLLLFVAVLTACSGDNMDADVASADRLVVGRTVSVSGKGESSVLTVESNGGWTVSSNVDWLTIAQPLGGQGSGTQNIVLEAAASTLSSQRTGNLTLVTIDGVRALVTVTQRPGDIILRASPDSLYFTYEGGDAKVVVTSNTSWKATSTTEWLFVNEGNEYEGNGTETLTLTAGANATDNERRGTIVLQAQDKEEHVVVSVIVGGRRPSIIVTVEDFGGGELPAEGGQLGLFVRSNFDWLASVEGGFFEGEQQRYTHQASSEDVLLRFYVSGNSKEEPQDIRVSLRPDTHTGIQETEGSTWSRTFRQAAGQRPGFLNFTAVSDGRDGAVVQFSVVSGTFEVTDCGIFYSTEESEVAAVTYDLIRGSRQTVGLSDNHTAIEVINGLRLGTTYYVRAYARNKVGVTLSPLPVPFTTPSIPSSDDIDVPEMH